MRLIANKIPFVHVGVGAEFVGGNREREKERERGEKDVR